MARDGSARDADISIVEGESAVGGGAAPDAHLKTWLVSVKDKKKSVEKLAEEFRQMEFPIIAAWRG